MKIINETNVNCENSKFIKTIKATINKCQIK